MKYIVIPATEPARIEEGKLTGEKVQEIVGGYFDVLSAPGGAVLWFGENAKRQGQPPNATAGVVLAWSGGFPGDYVAGTAILTGAADGRGDPTDVPAPYLAIVAGQE